MSGPAAVQAASPAAARLARQVAALWPRAQEYWSAFALMRPPRLISCDRSLAYHDSLTREICINADRVVAEGLEDCLEVILAHEVGHHLHHPGTMARTARMLLLQRALMPYASFHLINLFDDLLINAHLGRSLRDQVLKVYAAGCRSFGQAEDGTYFFYLMLYEELWQLAPGCLLGPVQQPFEQAFPGSRAQASQVVTDLFNLAPNVFTQFVYFLASIARYLDPAATPRGLMDLDAWGCPEAVPSADDLANALLPAGAESEAVERALSEGWINPKQAARAHDRVRQFSRALPGTAGGKPVDVGAVMAAYYRRQAEQHLLPPPPAPRPVDPELPTVLEEWESSEPSTRIDWLATLAAGGDELWPAFARQRLLEDGPAGERPGRWHAWLELYLDVSGSMPDPRVSLNPMTLAALVLALSAVRAGGSVRPVLYSGNVIEMDSGSWVASETDVARFLMQYIGQGTVFPFELLRTRCRCRTTDDQPVRVVVSDCDFVANVASRPANGPLLRECAAASHRLVALLLGVQKPQIDLLTPLGIDVVPVSASTDFPSVAGRLADSLFGEDRRGR